MARRTTTVSRTSKSKIPFEEILATSITACVNAWNNGDAFAFRRAVEMLEMLSARRKLNGKKRRTLYKSISEYRAEILEPAIQDIDSRIAKGEKKAELIFQVYAPFFKFIIDELEEAGLLLMIREIPVSYM